MVEVNRIPQLGGASSALAKVGQGAQTRTATQSPRSLQRPSTMQGGPINVSPSGVVLPPGSPSFAFQGGGPEFANPPAFPLGFPTRPETGSNPFADLGTTSPVGPLAGFPTKPEGFESVPVPAAPPALPPGVQMLPQPFGPPLFVGAQGVPITPEMEAFFQSIGQTPGVPGAPPPSASGLPQPAPALIPEVLPPDPAQAPGPGVEPGSFFAEFPGALPGRNFVNEIAPFILGAAQGETPEAFQSGIDTLTQLTGENAAPSVEAALQALTQLQTQGPQGFQQALQQLQSGGDRTGVTQAQDVFNAIASGGTTQSEAFQNAVIQPVLSALADAGVSRSGIVGSQVAEATIPFLLQAAQSLAQTSLGQQAQDTTTSQTLGALGLAGQNSASQLAGQQANIGLADLAQRGELATNLAQLGGAQQQQQLGAAGLGANLGLQGLTTEEGIANNLLAQLGAFGGLQQTLEQAGLDQQSGLAQALLLGPTAQTLLPGAIGQSGQVPSSFSFGIPGLFSSQK